MKQTKAPFPWGSIIHIFKPEIVSKLQLLLQEPELHESDIQGQSKQRHLTNIVCEQTSDILRSNRLKDELYAECI